MVISPVIRLNQVGNGHTALKKLQKGCTTYMHQTLQTKQLSP